ncbi:repeat protein [Moumouvirus goulette]|uniref:Repeat protein n=1 Tax=Moumouvirus goulette TaxID=1247379 RepID=M1PI01_9VIRU|nr:repeat protein [Moumouvirus goulette]AGF85728.1 repeat protein [Moumouvirus goulette]
MSLKLYFKITNESECHHGYQYKNGLNILEGEFNDDPKDYCVPGRLYFCEPKDIHHYLGYGIYLREIYLPTENPNFKMVINRLKIYGANMIILGKKYHLNDLSTWKYMVECGLDINWNENEPLKCAIYYGYLEIVKKLIKCEDNFSAYQKICGNSLVYAINGGYLDIVKRLTNTLSTYSDLSYALLHSSSSGNLEIVQFLIESGANIHANNDIALKTASLNGHLEIVQYLVSIGANINTSKNYAIRWAARRGHLQVVKYLLECGVDICANNNYTLRCIIDYGHPKIVEYVMGLNDYGRIYKNYKYEPVNISNYEHTKELKSISTCGSLEKIKNLIDDGANIHDEDDYVLRHAAREGRLHVVKYLIEKGAYIHARDDYALRWAARRGYLNVVQYLVEMGAITNTHDNYAIKWASKKGHSEVVEYLKNLN